MAPTQQSAHTSQCACVGAAKALQAPISPPPAEAQCRAPAYQAVPIRARSPRAAGRPGPPPVARSKQAQLAEANGRKCNMLVILLAQQMFTRPRAISACCCCWSSTKFKLTHSAPATACEDLGMLPTAFVGSFWTMVCCASASCVNLATQPWSSPCNISTARSVRHDKGAAAARKLPGWRSRVVGGG